MSRLVYLSLGSNLGDRAGHLRDAIARLEKVGRVVAASSFYETEPVEFTDQPWFVNSAVVLETNVSPDDLLKLLLAIEREMGRDRSREQKKGPRIIDLDILLFGNEVIDTPELTVPHPAMHERRFVLEPLAEIAPNAIHPKLKKTIEQLWRELPEGQCVSKIQNRPRIHRDHHG